MKAAVVVYPGSNCDRDTYHALKITGFEPSYVMFYEGEVDLSEFDLVVLPGGFSYGDYLRPGAVAARERISRSVKRFAENGGLVLGICNGFQVLMEMGLLPGALLQNENGKFICKWVELKVQDNTTPFTLAFKKGERIRLPIAHGFGRYVKDGFPRVVLKYTKNVNGSDDRIAGVVNENGNVFGLMPHPERASEDMLGGSDGRKVFQSLAMYLERRGKRS